MKSEKAYECVPCPNLYKRYCDKKLKEIMPFLKKRDSILDAGCGGEKHPYCFLKLENLCPKLKGIDFNNHWHPKILKGDLNALKFKSNSFDTAICLDVLEHIPEWETALNELIRVSKKRVILIVPTSENKMFRLFTNFLRKLIGINNPLLVGHYREFFPEQIIHFRNKKISSVFFKKINQPIPLAVIFNKTRIFYAGIYIIDLK